MNRTFHIRKAHSDDASALAALAETSFRETYTAFNTAEDMDLHCRQNFSAEMQRAEIKSDDQVTLLAAGEDGLAGFAQLHLDKVQPKEGFEVVGEHTFQLGSVAQRDFIMCLRIGHT